MSKSVIQHLVAHHTKSADHYLKCAKLHKACAAVMSDKVAKASNEFEKSASEAQLDFHKAMQGHCEDMGEWHVQCATLCAEMPEVSTVSSDGSGDGDAKIDNVLSAAARIDALNKVVPDGVRLAFESPAKSDDLTKGLRLIGRAGAPTSGDAKGIDPEFKHLAEG